MDYSLLIAYLRQKQYITDLEKDILDTWNELQKSPFDRSSAQLQIMQNNAKHPLSSSVSVACEIRISNQLNFFNCRYGAVFLSLQSLIQLVH